MRDNTDMIHKRYGVGTLIRNNNKDYLQADATTEMANHEVDADGDTWYTENVRTFYLQSARRHLSDLHVFTANSAELEIARAATAAQQTHSTVWRGHSGKSTGIRIRDFGACFVAMRLTPLSLPAGHYHAPNRARNSVPPYAWQCQTLDVVRTICLQPSVLGGAQVDLSPMLKWERNWNDLLVE